MNVKRILTPIDFSNVSMNGLRYAFEFAKKLRAELILFHAVSIPVNRTSNNTFQGDIFDVEEEAKEKLEKICENLAPKNFFTGINYMFEVRVGLAEDEILKAIKDKKVDLVIMGTKGAEGIDTITGTMSSDILAKSSCPVLIIPKDFPYAELKKIVYATDLLGEETGDINFVIDFAKIFGSHIAFLNIQKENPENVQDLISKGVNMINKNEYEDMSFHVIEEEDVIEGINYFAEKEKSDIIVMATYKRNFLQSIISRSHTKQIAYHTRIPLLSLHKEKVNKEVSA